MNTNKALRLRQLRYLLRRCRAINVKRFIEHGDKAQAIRYDELLEQINLMKGQ